jgi:ABC-type Mn2+/Zn2+ transport system ATPase subunit
MTRPLISTEGLEIGYAGKPLLAPLSFEIAPGQFWCVLGRNGAGKSTLVRTLLGLLAPVAGAYTSIEGLSLGYLPQQARFDDLYPMSARDVVLMGTDRGLSFLKPRSREVNRRADSILTDLGLQALGSIRYRDLSAGQKQRVLLARLSAGSPTLAFLDEPTTAMDQPAERQAFRHMAEQCAKNGSSMVVVTHDFLLARSFSDHALFVDDATKRIVLGPIEQVLESEALQHRYGLPVKGSAR